MVPKLRLLPFLGLALLPSLLAAAELGPAYREVSVETSKTSIYVGSVTLRMPPFVRRGDEYHSTYVAKVRPYFFSSENGSLSIRFTDDELRRLAAGETIEFTGHAQNEDGEPRAITGRAVPADAHSGKLKVRVRVTSKIELIFNTTYRFTG